MALINLQTDLKSLRYGKDTPGGGDSGQPYIKVTIPRGFVGASEDFLLRGGINAVTDSLTDVARLAKMFVDTRSPNGLLFIAKQQLLSRTAVRTQTSGILNEGIYSPLNTLAQAGVVAFGGHLNKQGINPFAQTGAYANNEALYNTRVKNTQETSENRLIRIYSSITNNTSATIDKTTYNQNNAGVNIITYTGGPDSILGIGNTNIRFADQRTGTQNAQAISNPTFFYNGSQFSVNADNKQVGGLQVNVGNGTKTWIKGGVYFDGGAKNFYIIPNEFPNGLPSNNVNTPQSSSLVNIPNISQQKSVNENNIQVGGLQVNVGDGTKTWIKGGVYFDGGAKNFYIIPDNFSKGLPSSNINTPQSSSLDKIPDGEQTWTPNQELADGRNWVNLAISSSINSKNSSSVSQAYEQSNKEQLGIPSNPGEQVYLNSVGVNSELYNLNAEGPQTWTPNQQEELVELRKKADINDGNSVSAIFVSSSISPSQYSSITLDSSGVLLDPDELYKNSSLVNANGTYVYNQKDIIETPNNTSKLSGSPRIQDFRKILRAISGQNPQSISAASATISGQLSTSLEYSGPNAGNIEKRVNLGDPGARADKDYSDYSKGITYNSQQVNANSKLVGAYTPGLDKITSIPIYRSEDTSTELNAVNDLVKFRIAVIDNNSPNFKTFIHFRAFIDSMSDTYSATWSGFNYLGRSEQFYNYGGFTRTVSLSWTVAAQSKQELIPMYKKLNYLASSLTGDYSPDGYMRGNLVQLTIGGYLYEQPGIITSLTYDIPTESPWEIGIGTGFDASGNTIQGDSSVKELPHIIRVTGFNFIPIQRFIPQKQQLTFSPISKLGAINNDVGFVEINGDQRYIALANGFGSTKNNYDN
jgi:hypothetical protein